MAEKAWVLAHVGQRVTECQRPRPSDRLKVAIEPAHDDAASPPSGADGQEEAVAIVEDGRVHASLGHARPQVGFVEPDRPAGGLVRWFAREMIPVPALGAPRLVPWR